MNSAFITALTGSARPTRAAILGLLALCAAVLLGLSACGGGGDGGVSGGGTGGGNLLLLKQAGGAQRTDEPISTSAVEGLGDAAVYLGGIGFQQTQTTALAADGLALPVSVGPGAQLGVLPVERSFTRVGAQLVAQRFALRAAVGLLVVDAQAGAPHQLRVNGQRILTDRRTVLVDVPSLAALAGRNVAVSGYLEPLRNDIIATRIEAVPAGFDLGSERVVTAQVLAVDAATQTANLGFAQLRTNAIDPRTPVQAGQWLNLRVRVDVSSPSLEPLEVQVIGAVAATGELALRDVVTSRPSDAQPSAPLVVGGYTIDASVIEPTVIKDLRLGSVVEVRGLQSGTTVIVAKSLRLVANPIDPHPGEPDAPIEPGGEDGVPRDDYRIIDALIEQLDTAQRSFVLNGQRVLLHDQHPPVTLANGQRVTVSGETRNDAQGQYLLVKITP